MDADCRRLYDICNVLVELGLAEKVPTPEQGLVRAAYVWTGPKFCEFSAIPPSDNGAGQPETVSSEVVQNGQSVVELQPQQPVVHPTWQLWFTGAEEQQVESEEDTISELRQSSFEFDPDDLEAMWAEDLASWDEEVPLCSSGLLKRVACPERPVTPTKCASKQSLAHSPAQK
eukprot:c17201_g1_i1.p1 GENE.c17201_g1_i1~~c17201_g1_i1.p1  ORF type:complete len:173 (+),score=35.63 c17201_g1_i1:888-1406(+)